MKVQSKSRDTYDWSRVAYSNETMFCYPDQSTILMHFMQRFNADGKLWKVADIESGDTMRVKGVGHCRSCVFEVNMKHIPTELGWFGRLGSNVAYYSEMVLSLLLFPIFGLCKSFVFIDGVACGRFEAKIKFAENMGLVLMC